jgi:SAM-dependent methyltransferase
MSATANPIHAALTWDLVAPGYAETLVQHFEFYSAESLRWAGLGAGARVLDVATGPGTLALQACRVVGEVEALDFSEKMIEALRARAAGLGVSNLRAVQGDGHALPYEDGSFDGAFSMFGVMMFEDRAKALGELRRVLRPGGTLVVSSWLPMDEVPMIQTVFEGLYEALPQLPKGDPRGPWSDPETLRAELSEAGFEAEVRRLDHVWVSESLEAFWDTMRRSFAPLVLLEHRMGAGFGAVAGVVQARLLAKHGPGEVRMNMPAWLARGVAR